VQKLPNASTQAAAETKERKASRPTSKAVSTRVAAGHSRYHFGKDFNVCIQIDLPRRHLRQFSSCKGLSVTLLPA
jgi:hypothetical protein